MSISKVSSYTIIFPINPQKNLYCRHLGDSYTLYAPQTRGERTSGHSVSTRWILSSCVHTHGYLGPTSLLAISPAWLRSELGGKIYYMDILFQPGTWPLGEEVWLLKQQTVNQPRGRSNINFFDVLLFFSSVGEMFVTMLCWNKTELFIVSALVFTETKNKNRIFYQILLIPNWGCSEN